MTYRHGKRAKFFRIMRKLAAGQKLAPGESKVLDRELGFRGLHRSPA